MSGIKSNAGHCDARINNITQKLAMLYLAAENIMIDGVEYFYTAIPELESKLSELQAYTHLSDLAEWRSIYTTQYWPSSQEYPNGQVSTWFNMDVTNIYLHFADLTGDGIYEMILTATGTGYEDEYPVTAIQALMLADNEYGYTQLYYNHLDGYMTLHNDIQIGIASDANGQVGILEIYDTIWQGIESSSYQFYSYNANGEANAIPGESWDTALGDEQTAVIESLYSCDTLLLYAEHEQHLKSGLSGSTYFAYQDERSSWFFEEDTSDYVEDGGLSAELSDTETEEWEVLEEDPQMDYIIEQLTMNTWHSSFNGYGLTLLFTGGKADLTSHLYVDADATDYTAEIMLGFGTSIDVELIDNQAYASYLPHIFLVPDYYIYYNPELNEINVFLGDETAITFYTSTGVVLE